MTMRPTPESLRFAADKTEAAEAARKAALAARAIAQAEATKAATANRQADDALLNAGVDIGVVGADDGNNGNRNNGGNGNSGGAGNGNNIAGQSNLAGGNGTAKAVAWIALGIALLAFVAVFVLGLVKPSQSFVDFIAITAKEARDLATDAQSKIGILKKEVDQVAAVADLANDRADKALNKPACQATCVTQTQKRVYSPKRQVVPTPQTVVPQPAAKSAPGGCIYSSDGNAVLKGGSAPLAKGTEIARILNADLVKIYPDALDSDASHLKACQLWSASSASSFQDSNGLRVNQDTHRIQN